MKFRNFNANVVVSYGVTIVGFLMFSMGNAIIRQQKDSYGRQNAPWANNAFSDNVKIGMYGNTL